jgi:4-hydroxy-tetrahydrodipicolinate reductase
MGRALIEAVLASDDCAMSGAMDAPGAACLGHDAGAPAGGATGVLVTADRHAALRGADVLIDFTRPDGTLANLQACRELGVRAVIGTTGFTPPQRAAIEAHAQQVATLLSANMSVGVNVMLSLLRQATVALGAGYDIEVIEAHHRHKVDAPSGTALAMGEVLARARGVDLARTGVFSRHGQTGERSAGAIGFASIRGGDIVGEHRVMFAGEGERLEITHKSSSRANYADGSLRAARFLAALPPGRTGLFGMADVLGLA